LLEDLVGNGSAIINRATIAVDGQLTADYLYLQDYVDGNGKV
jgi:hypothetical protein